MNTWIHSLLQELEDKLSYLPGADALMACRECNARLSGYMEKYVFQTRAEEILYFKTFKPRFMAHRLKYEVIARGENLDMNAVAPWFREYYTSGQSNADGLHFTHRCCHKCDFELPIQSTVPIGSEMADKQVARLLAEEWLAKEICVCMSVPKNSIWA